MTLRPKLLSQLVRNAINIMVRPQIIIQHKLHDRLDGLAHCMVCEGAEGSLPSDCPGYRLSSTQLNCILFGEHDFISGKWHLCSLKTGQLEAQRNKQQYLKSLGS